MHAMELIPRLLAIIAVLLVSVVDARTTHSVLDGLLRRISVDPSPGAVLRRQGAIPSVPTQCKSSCDPVNAVLSTGTCPKSTCCTTTFTKGYFDCFQCVAESVNLTDFSSPQALVDGIITTCASFGISLPVLTFPGQNPSRSLATIAPPSTSNTNPPTSRTTITNTNSITTTPSSSTTTPISQSTVTSLPTPTAPIPSPAPTPGAGTFLRVTGSDLLGGAIVTFLFANLLQIVL